MRLGYIIEAKPELIVKLRSENNDLHEYFSESHILATEEHEYEEAFEGWKKKILECAKITFVNETIFSLDLKADELKSIFGEYNSEIEIFNHWWNLKEADCEIIPTTWLT